MYRVLLLSAVAMLTACAHEDGGLVVAAPVAPPTKPGATGAAQPPAPRALSGVSIHMERKACYGICPSYFVDITGDGQVVYLGREFVGVRGQKKGTANPTQLIQLMDAVDSLRLTTLANAPACATMDADQPTVVLSIRDMGATTKVAHNLGNSCYPKGLAELESMIDEVANTSQWTRCETGFCLN